MYMAGIKKLTPQITEMNVCFQVINTANYTRINYLKSTFTKTTNSFQSSMSHHWAVMEDFMNRKKK